jgi:hypothetical protein
VGVGPAVGVGVPLGEGEALDDGVALVVGAGLSEGAAEAVGPSATGRGPFGRAAKKRGGRLNVGTSAQNGECGSSAK